MFLCFLYFHFLSMEDKKKFDTNNQFWGRKMSKRKTLLILFHLYMTHTRMHIYIYIYTPWGCFMCGARYAICSPVTVSYAETDKKKQTFKMSLNFDWPNVLSRLVVFYDSTAEFFVQYDFTKIWDKIKGALQFEFGVWYVRISQY
jgi:hypothetical protein